MNKRKELSLYMSKGIFLLGCVFLVGCGGGSRQVDPNHWTALG